LLLLADFVDVLKTALPIIFFILYGVAQLIGAKQEQNRRPPAKRPRPAPPGEGRGPVEGQGHLEERLRSEVEEFLRRAQGPPPAKPAQRGAAARRGPRPTPQGSEPPRREAPTRRLTPASTPLGPKAAPQGGAQPLGSGVSQHVAEHLGRSSALAQHAQQLGAEVALADDRLEQHLKEKFVHQVGALPPAATSAERRTAAASPMAADFLKLLARPEGVRQAFIASEIFRPPVERWDEGGS